MIERYKTVYHRAHAEYIDKKSRFIATVCPVQSEEAAQIFIEEMRKMYRDATHNVFAYQVGACDQIQRYSDDGEPTGTAGMPILDLLRGAGLKNTAVVVTRYFGGTLLGTGGLVRAYAKSAKEGIAAAGIIEKILYRLFHVTVEYTLQGKVQYEILQKEYIIYDTLYAEKITFVILVQNPLKDVFIKEVMELTSGQTMIEEKGIQYGAWVNEVLQLDEEE